MNSTCGLCGRENVFIGEKGVCCVCCQLLAFCSIEKEDVCLMLPGSSSSFSDAS